MISPGCSFKFAGLKQTLLSIRPGIETHLKKVTHLLTNYRTTKDVLEVGNAILSKAKQYFPSAIEFARKERAVNDFGLHVVISDWDEALSTKPLFGKDQVVVFSFSKDNSTSIASLKNWLGDHPFILSVLDSKGLEFDDIVVAFDLERICWKVESENVSSLKMLRELYVAVTRAKRRVVILVKRKSDTMLKFLSELDYNLEYHSDTNELFEEFNTLTSLDQWLQRAEALFQDEKFEVTSRCYEKATSYGMAAWARAKNHALNHNNKSAIDQFLLASRIFYEKLEYKRILDLASDLLKVVSWDERPPRFIDLRIWNEAMRHYPLHLKPCVRKSVDVFRDDWSALSLEDIENKHQLVHRRRHFPGLEEFLHSHNSSDLEKMATLIPCIIGDIYLHQQQLLLAIKVYLKGKDVEMAKESSEKMIRRLRKNGSPSDLLKFLDEWMLYKDAVSGRPLRLLLDIFNDPEQIAKTHPVQCLEELGPNAIKFIVNYKDLSPLCLHLFCKDTFHDEVMKELQRQNEHNLAGIVQWFVLHEVLEHAQTFISEHISKWNIKELKSFIAAGLLSAEIAQEFHNRKCYFEATDLFIRCTEPQKAISSADKVLSSIEGAEKHSWEIAMLLRYQKIPANAPKRIRLLMTMFRQPGRMERICCEESMRAFGANVITEFVLRSAPHSESERDKDGVYRRAYVDIYETLKQFKNNPSWIPRSAALEYFFTHNGDAKLFIEFHIKSWSKSDLYFMLKKGFFTERLADEFMSRHHFATAAKLYLRLRLFEESIMASEKALASKELACRSSDELREAWLNENYHSRYNEEQQQKVPKKSNLGLFLLLWQDPIEARALDPLECFQRFGASIVRKAILRHAPYSIQGEDDSYEDELEVLASFDSDAFKHDGERIVEHYEKRGDKENVIRFLSNNMTLWQDIFLKEIAKKKLGSVKGYPEELQRRGFFHLAAVQYVNVGDWEKAVYATEEDLRMNLVDWNKAKETIRL